MLAIVAPGQGAQTPGFLAPWLDDPAVAGRLEWLSAVAGIDLVAAGTTGSAEEIRDTAVAQPLLLAAALVTAEALAGRVGDTSPPTGTHLPADVIAGHSVGELAAAVLAGVLSAEQAMVLVRERGRAMAAASARTPTGMTAVLGGDAEQVRATLARHGLTAANDNGAGQLVAAGTVTALEAFAADPPQRARLIPLPVAGAFHTRHMAAAIDTLARLSPSVPVGEPRTRLLSNADGAVVTSGRDYLDRLVAQVGAPVRWDLCMDTLAGLGVNGLVELAPGGTLTGLARRGLKGVPTVALKGPDDLHAAQELLAGPASAARSTVAPRREGAQS